MNWRHTIFTSFLLSALGGAVSAHAEDVDLDSAPEVTISAAQGGSQGIYLRGDLGYAPWLAEGDPSLDVYNAATGATDTVSFDDARFGKPFSGTVGIGYQLNDVFRADLTGEYFDGRFDGSGEAALPCAGEAVGTSCTGSEDAGYKAIGLMANAYADFGTLAGFTPYLGAGLGMTQLRWNDVSLTTACVAGAIACSGTTASTVSFDGESSWRFTYALMAGASYDITDRLKVDLAYRYSKIADGGMFAGAVSGHDDGLARQEFRAGLRFSLW